jgi:hypothetical protein
MATAIDRAKALLKLAKSVDDGVLADVAQIDDITLNKEKVPSAAEIGSQGGSLDMRGMEALHNRMEPGTPQMGTVKDYEELVGRMGRTEKALGILAANVAKGFEMLSAQAKSQPDGLEAALLKVRKAKVLITKAEDDEEDDDDFAERMDKAVSLLDGAKGLIEKAEEEADDEDKESAAEKARGAYSKMRKAVKAAREARAAAKAEKIAAAEKAEADKAAALKKAEDDEKMTAEEEAKEKARLAAEATSKSETAPAVDPLIAGEMKSITAQLGVLSTNVNGLMDRIGGASRATAAPMVVKADTGTGTAVIKGSETVSDAIEDLAENGVLDLGAVIKGRSLINRLRAVEDGKLDRAVFDAEVAQAPDRLKNLFTPAAA